MDNETTIKKLIGTIKKIWDSDEYEKRRKKIGRYRKYYTGEYWPEPKDNDEAKESEIAANYMFSTIMTIAPMLTDNRPIWNLRTDYPFFQPLANVYKAAGDSVWSDEEMDSKLFKACLDALIGGFGVLQVSFDPERTIRGEIAYDVIDPLTYFQAPGFDDEWESPLCGTVTERSLWWIRANFPPELADKVQAENKDQKSDGVIQQIKSVLTGGRAEHEYLGDKANVYTVWMRDDSFIELKTEDEDGKKTKAKKYPNGRFMVFTDKVMLMDKPYGYNHGKPPWVLLRDYNNPHMWDGIGEPQQMEGLVLEHNLALRALATHVRMYARRDWVIEEGTGLDADEFKAGMLNKKPNVWQINTGSTPPAQVEVKPVDQSTVAFVNGLPTIIQEITGVTDVSQGIASKKQRQSAHEVTALLETSYTRTRQRVRNVEAFIKRVMILTIEIMQQFYDTTRSFSTKDENNQTVWYSLENTAEYAGKMMQPGLEKPGTEPPGQNEPAEDEETVMLRQQWQDYSDLMAKIGNENSVYFRFHVDIESNSTLPMDQQSLANMYLQLAQLGHMDTLSLLKGLHIPNPEQIVERLKKDAREKAQMQAGPPAPPPPEGGMQ